MLHGKVNTCDEYPIFSNLMHYIPTYTCLSMDMLGLSMMLFLFIYFRTRIP